MGDSIARQPAFQAIVICIQDFYNSPVRCFDKSIFVDPREGCQPSDQADVRAFWRFDRAYPSVVRMVNVTHIETSTFSPQTARAERRKRAFMPQLGQWIGLVHELRQLARAKELA